MTTVPLAKDEFPYEPTLTSVTSCSEASYNLQEEDCSASQPSLHDTSTTITYTNIHEKHQSSNVTAFVSLLKALFGVSLLSSPRVLGETGLVLGTLVYSAIVLACVGSCWCLLQARTKLTANSQQQQQQPQRPKLAEPIVDYSVSDAITYGDLGRTLLGVKQSILINFLIVSLHICFGAGLVATSIHQIMVVLGWSPDYIDEDSNNNNNNNNDSADEEEDSEWFAGRVILACLAFPIIFVLLQFRNIQDLFCICLAGIVVFVVGCVGTMLYSTILVDNNDGDGNAIWDIPQDALEWKWSGIPNFVASTLCAMEGINLALPIANQFYLGYGNDHNRQKRINWTPEVRSPVPVVTAAVAVFGILTLLVAYFGYLSGLGGGSGTQHEDDNSETEDCPFVAYCLDSNLLQTIHRLSLTCALILTLPIILYPSLEILERWSEERHWQLKTGKTSSDRDLGESFNGFVFSPPSDSQKRLMEVEEALFGDDPFFPGLHRHWRLRISHAAAVCLFAIFDRQCNRGLVLYKGIGLSTACFLLPVILFVRAHSLAKVLQRPGLVAALAGLMTLGIVNFILVILSVFTDHNFLPTELHDDPLHHHHESHSGD